MVLWSVMDVRVGLWRRLSAEELMLLNCGVGEDSWESLGLQGDPTSPFWGDQPWDFFGGNDAKAEAPVLWPPHAKCWLFGKDPDAGRVRGQEEKGTTEDEMAEWHHQLNGDEFEWTPGDGQGGLACCDSWGRKGSDMTEQLNWTETFITPKTSFAIKDISQMLRISHLILPFHHLSYDHDYNCSSHNMIHLRTTRS